MMKKIGQYLPFALAVLALVMLLINAAGREAPAETAPPTTDPTTQTTGETLNETQPAAPQDAMTRVEQALDRYPLDETAMALCVYDGGLNSDASTTGLGRTANSNALARLCDEQRMNPIAAFWLLEREDLYGYAKDTDDIFRVPAFSLPLQVRKEYPNTHEGTRQLLTDILKLSGGVEDGLNMDAKLLGENGVVDNDQVFYEEGDCRYAYFVYYGDRSAHFLCFYVRGGEKIESLEMQLLSLRYAEGDEEALTKLDQLADRQAASLMAAAEQLLTGTSRADEGCVPLRYTCDGSKATIDRYTITGSGETGKLTNYALQLK